MRRGGYFFSAVIISLFVIMTLTPLITAQAAGIDEECATVLKKMTDYVEAQQQFLFEAETTEEFIKNDGSKIKVTRTGKAKLKRDNRLQMAATRDDAHKELWYNGSQVTIFDKVENLYATIDVPATIVEALDFTMDHLDFTMPLIDFFIADLYGNFTAELEGSKYEGKDTVGAYTCHHLVFNQDEIDWEIWIEDSTVPVPRKLVITYKNVESQPTFEAVFPKWDFTVEFSNDDFIFNPPLGADETEFLVEDVEEGKEGGDV